MPGLFRKSGKNSKLLYYLKGYFNYLMPACLYRRRLQKALQEIEQREDRAYIHERAEYYNKLTANTPLAPNSPTLAEHKPGKIKSVYFFDSYEYTRWFPKHLRWSLIPGDTNYLVSHPAIVKARPLSENNANSVLLNMDKVRHFVFLQDRKPFREKMNKVIFRGETDGKPWRQDFVRRFHEHPLCDAGDSASLPHAPAAPLLTLYQHLDYKFIMSLEGNDVASNLKWVMSSNSVAVMPRPTCETWFMEGRLIPDYHYIEIKPDYSDFVERIRYYIAHPEAAERIIANAHAYVAQFKDKKRERLISLLVLKKYFDRTKQS